MQNWVSIFFQILFKMRKKYPLKVYDRIQNDNMIDCLQMLIYKIIILGGRTYSNLILTRNQMKNTFLYNL